MFSDNKLTYCPRQRWCIFQINARQSLPTIARKRDYVTGWPRMIKRGPTWRREEWRWPLYVNARPHAIRRLCGLSTCPMRCVYEGKKKSFGIGATRFFAGYAFLRLAGIISFFGRRFVMPTSSVIRPPAPWSLWYSRVKCGSYLDANEDRFFNWRAKVKFTLLKINKLRRLVCLLDDDAANVCFI